MKKVQVSKTAPTKTVVGAPTLKLNEVGRKIFSCYSKNLLDIRMTVVRETPQALFVTCSEIFGIFQVHHSCVAPI